MSSIVRELTEIFFGKKVSRSAAQLSYYLVLSLFPLLICLTAMTAGWEAAGGDFIEDIRAFIPASAYESLVDYLDYVSENFSAAMTIAALTVLITASSAAFRAILTVMEDIQEEHRYIGFWKGIFSIVLSLGFLLAMYASCAIIIMGSRFAALAAEYIGSDAAAPWQWLRFGLLFALLFVMIYGVYRLSAPKGKRREQRVIGAAAAAMTLVAAGMFFSWTISISGRYPLIYGSLASVIILMIWLFICGNILIMGNAFNVVINRRVALRRYIRQRNKRKN